MCPFQNTIICCYYGMYMKQSPFKPRGIPANLFLFLRMQNISDLELLWVTLQRIDPWYRSVSHLGVYETPNIWYISRYPRSIWESALFALISAQTCFWILVACDYCVIWNSISASLLSNSPRNTFSHKSRLSTFTSCLICVSNIHELISVDSTC